MYAIVECGGKQFKVSAGDVIFVEKVNTEVGQDVTLDKVFLLNKDGNVAVGAPTIEGAAVKAQVIYHGRAKKIIVFKYKSKKNYHKKQGHRQPFTKLLITDIVG